VGGSVSDNDAVVRELEERFGEGEVRDLTRLSGGASRETWAFELVHADGRAEPMILQRDRAGATRTGGGMATEARVLVAAAEAGVPVPRLRLDATDGLVGQPAFVTERIEGETIARRILRDDAYAAARPLLAAQCGRVLATIHQIPPDSVPALEHQDQLTQFRAVLDGFNEPHPAFELGFRWLEANRPPPTRTAIVHGDFRNGNMIIGPDGIRAVLDWELAHLGDPMEDLGWLCVRAWRFGAEPPVGGFGPREDLFAAYGEVAGTPVDPEVVRWWEVLGTLKWGVMCMIQAASHLQGFVRSVELAAIGRRVCENEHDLLTLLAPPSAPNARFENEIRPQGAEGARKAGLHGRPTVGELVEAVREYLERDVMAGTEGRLQFHARVAVNALKIVERELEHGEEMAAAHAARLKKLGYADDAALAAAIRSGELDGRIDEVTTAVHASVLDKLLVANPKYLG
jgi:aminoglycoside phosphotransferase (APT) family kinase protein